MSMTARRFSIFAAVLLMTSPALAAEKYYSLFGNVYAPAKTSTTDKAFKPLDVDYNTGWGVGGTVGVAWDNGLRLENELSYKQADSRNTSDHAWALGWLLNGWFDLRNSSPWTPYLGGGLGLGRGHAASPGNVDNTGTGLAYQAGCGVAVKLGNGLDLDLGYRYFGIADTSDEGIGSGDMDGSSFQAGVRLKF